VTPFTPEEIRRYVRHLLLPEVGIEGQRRLKEAKVLCVGAGGLGSPLALYLAAAGVGRLGIVDADVVDESNLQRQILHGTSDIGKAKVRSAAETLQETNPLVDLVLHEVHLDSTNALDILRGYDVVADCSDNFPTRYLVNDACVLTEKANAYGAVFRFEGQASVLCHPEGPCYRCLYPEPPPPELAPSCMEAGILGILPGVIGLVQATEVIKHVVGIGEPLVGRLLLYDALAMRFREMRIERDPACPVCGERRTVTELIDYEGFCGTTEHEARGTVPPELEIEPKALATRLEAGEDIFLLDVRTNAENELCGLEGALLIPLRELAGALDRLDLKRETIVYCRRGIRSARAVNFLRDKGFRNVWNLRGGLHAWSDEVDPSIPRY
jgi:molybdopterin/thiamine biosynthesis adenylyltransferase/rhodanese-related sulfurtransferase